MSDKNKGKDAQTGVQTPEPVAIPNAPTGRRRRRSFTRTVVPRDTIIVLIATDASGQPVPAANIQVLGTTQSGHEALDLVLAHPNATVIKVPPKTRAKPQEAGSQAGTDGNATMAAAAE